MKGNPFVASYSKLPGTIPVFPLSGAIVLPGSDLPLNIFEPRYLNMVNDALGSHRMIGMIQPDPFATDKERLYLTGCAGRITQYRETSDGRIEMVLTGVCRFDITEELTTTRGYRMVVPDWSRYEADYDQPPSTDDNEHQALVKDLKGYFERNKLEVDWPLLERLTTAKLVDSLTMALPLGPQDKQALLETPAAPDRAELLVSLINSQPQHPGSDVRH